MPRTSMTTGNKVKSSQAATKTQSQAHQKTGVGASEKSRNDTPASREEMISIAAYYRSEQRGFGGDPMVDWLAAEAEIDAMLEGRKQLSFH